MVKTGLKVYRNNIWHFFTILGFVALGLIIALAIIIPNMTNAVRNSTDALVKAGKNLIGSGFNTDKFINSLIDQFKAMNWTNPLTTLQELFTQSKLTKILEIAAEQGGIKLSEYPQFINDINSCVNSLLNTSVTQLSVLITCTAICSISGYVFIRTMIHFKTTNNRSILRYIINTLGNVLFLGLIVYLLTISLLNTKGAGLVFSLIAILLLLTIGVLTLSFLAYAKKKTKFTEIVNIKTIIMSIISDLVVVSISFAVVAIIYPFNSLLAIMIGIPLLLVTTVIMDCTTNAYVNNFSNLNSKKV